MFQEVTFEVIPWWITGCVWKEEDSKMGPIPWLIAPAAAVSLLEPAVSAALSQGFLQPLRNVQVHMQGSLSGPEIRAQRQWWATEVGKCHTFPAQSPGQSTRFYGSSQEPLSTVTRAPWRAFPLSMPHCHLYFLSLILSRRASQRNHLHPRPPLRVCFWRTLSQTPALNCLSCCWTNKLSF